MNRLTQTIATIGAGSLTTAELLALMMWRNPTEEHIARAQAQLTHSNEVREPLARNLYAIAARELTSRVMLDELRAGAAMTDPRQSAAFLKARLGGKPYEVFAVLYLDNRHRVIAFEEMFRGTIDGASVHPREVVRGAMLHNAAAVIFAHNHPSGISEPSHADRAITSTLREALKLVGVRVLDHLVIGAGEPTSMAAQGLI